MLVAVGLNGAPGMVTSAFITIVFTDSNFSFPPILSMYELITSAAVNPSGIALLKIGLAIGLAYSS